MKIAGMIGGIGPESTEVYYRQIVSEFRAVKNDGSYPSLIVNSIDLKRAVDLITAGDDVGLIAYLRPEIARLAAAGADFGFLAANTPHIVFPELAQESPIPLISIVEATCSAAKELGLKRLGLFGTRFTMRGTFYHRIFSREGIALVTPEEPDVNFLHNIYMGELLNGIVLPETRNELVRIAERLREQASIEGLILGGTELSLILQEPTLCGIPLLDTTKIHVHAVVRELLR
jgi:aspartate racemase